MEIRGGRCFDCGLGAGRQTFGCGLEGASEGSFQLGLEIGKAQGMGAKAAKGYPEMCKLAMIQVGADRAGEYRQIGGSP